MTPPTITPPTLTPPRALPAPASPADELTIAFVKAFADGDRPAWDAFVRRHRDLPLTVHSLNSSVFGCLFAIGERMSELNRDTRALREIVAGKEIEPPSAVGGRLVFRITGLYQPGRSYKQGECMEYMKHIWYAKVDTVAGPTGPPMWPHWLHVEVIVESQSA